MKALRLSLMMTLLLPVTSASFASEQAKPWEAFANETVSQKYPQLIKHMRQRKRTNLYWESVDGTPAGAVLTLTADGLVVETHVPVSSTTTDYYERLFIADVDLDGHADRAIVEHRDGFGDKIIKPLGDALDLIWYTSLAMAFRQTGCCP